MRVHLWLFGRRRRRQRQGQPPRERRRGTQPRPCDDVGDAAPINAQEWQRMACQSSDRHRSSANRRSCAGPSVRRKSCTQIMQLKKIPGR
jgi:hypothetical protein